MSVPTSDKVASFVADLLVPRGRDPLYLLQYLIALQQRFSFVPEAAVEALAIGLGIGRTQIRGAVDFYAFLHQRPRGISTSC